MDIICITISVNYDDILKEIMYQNAKFFKIWYIVTASNDLDTINLVNNSNISNIKLLYYDDFKTNANFNFGGSRKFAQEYVLNNHDSCNILLLDSDIYLPNNFIDIISQITIKDDTIYGVAERIDYFTLDDFLNNNNQHINLCGKDFIGFFQLYKSSDKYKYEDSINCGGCDNIFRNKFTEKITLNISVKHLGCPGENWDGRIKNNFKSEKKILHYRLNKYK
jgi:hypothetical protein